MNEGGKVSFHATERCTWRSVLFCTVSVMAILLICSMNSPMYAYQTHHDVHCFITVARGIVHGMMPYRDLMEQKGPLTYLLHALAMWLIPGKFIEFWLMECLGVVASMFLMHRILRMYLPKINIGWSALVLSLLCSFFMFKQGDMVEELCWPFMLFSLYVGLYSLRSGKDLSLPMYVLNGFLAGCVSAIKVNLLGIHFAFMAVLAIHAATSGRSLLRAVKMCASFLLGMLLAWLPMLIWFGVNGALKDLWDVYIVENFTKYTVRRHSLFVRILIGVCRNSFRNKRYLMLVLLGNTALLVAPRRWIGLWEKALWLLAELVSTVFVYMGGRSYDYYLLALAPFGMLALLCLKVFERRIELKKTGAVLLSAALLAASVGSALCFSENRYLMFVAKEKYPQQMFAENMKQSPDATLLNYGFLDGGFYYAADVVPQYRYFCKLMIDKKGCDTIHEGYLRDSPPEYIVKRGKDLSESSEYAGKYMLINTFVPDTAEKKRISKDTFRLYRRKDSVDPPSAAAGER